MKIHSHTRRKMLYTLTAMTMSVASKRVLALTPAISPQSVSPTEPSPQVRLGAQTNAWPIDPSRFDTFLQALREIRETGYSGFETGFANLRSQSKSLSSAKDAISATGLSFLGIHIFLPEYDAETNIAPKHQALKETFSV